MSIKFPKLPSLKSLPKAQPAGRPQPKPALQVRDGFERSSKQGADAALRDGSRASHVPGSGGVKFLDLPDGAREKLESTNQISKVMADVPEGARPERLGDSLKPEDRIVKVMADVPEGARPERLGDSLKPEDRIVKVMADVPEGATSQRLSDAAEKVKAPLQKMRGDFPEGTFDQIVKVKMDLPEGH
jgi:hypothetical protein